MDFCNQANMLQRSGARAGRQLKSLYPEHAGTIQTLLLPCKFVTMHIALTGRTRLELASLKWLRLLLQGQALLCSFLTGVMS